MPNFTINFAHKTGNTFTIHPVQLTPFSESYLVYIHWINDQRFLVSRSSRDFSCTQVDSCTSIKCKGLITLQGRQPSPIELARMGPLVTNSNAITILRYTRNHAKNGSRYHVATLASQVRKSL